MQHIAGWLEKLGLAQYAQRFAENEIDVSVLRHLSDQDLKDIGVPLGHRRKILAAIGELTGASPATLEPAAGIEPKAQEFAERRHVTVMFSDLVGSTALSARMGPEDLREVISAYQKCVAETVRRFGGFVAKYLGDGVLVYFGYPQAHEDDAERAVRAGLELIEAVAALQFLAQGLARQGDQAAALAALREGLALADVTGEHFWDAELHRLTGTVLLAENKLDEGQASLQHAIHIAQGQQAKSLELRATTNLAHLWRDQGKRDEARELLAPVYGWFTEGFDTLDLKEAKALLDELAS